jgi:hypothetical protein
VYKEKHDIVSDVNVNEDEGKCKFLTLSCR